MIEVKNLVKQYGNQLVINDISFKMERGRIYGLLGKNGAGKSTIMNMMTGYIGSTSGEIIIDGHNILEEPKEAKKRIGYLPEVPPVYGDMTVQEYLQFSAELKGVVKTERGAEIERVMKITSTESMKDRLIKYLSKGYKQRVGLAHAIMGMPEVLILDEPTSGLDPYQIAEIRELVKTLSKDHTILLSSHILHEISAICDEVIVVSGGRIAACDSPENIEKTLGSKNTIKIEVKGDVDRARDVILSLEHVEKFEFHDNNRCSIQTVDNEDIREDIFWAFSKAGIAILSMQLQMQSLEELFLELTDDKVAGTDIQNGEQNENNI